MDFKMFAEVMIKVYNIPTRNSTIPFDNKNKCNVSTNSAGLTNSADPEHILGAVWSRFTLL